MGEDPYFVRALALAAATSIALGCASGQARSPDHEPEHGGGGGPDGAAAGDAGAGGRYGDAPGDGAPLATIDGTVGQQQRCTQTQPRPVTLPILVDCGRWHETSLGRGWIWLGAGHLCLGPH